MKMRAKHRIVEVLDIFVWNALATLEKFSKDPANQLLALQRDLVDKF